MLYLIRSIALFPLIGVDAHPVQGNQYRVDTIDPGFWAEGKLQPGDLLVEVNGESPSESFVLRTFEYLEMASSIKIVRESAGESQELSFDIPSDLTRNELVFRLILPSLSMLVFASFAFFVYRRKKEDPAAIYLILFFLSIGLAYLSSFSSGKGDLIGRTIMTIAFPAVPLTFLLFLNRYLLRYGKIFASRKVMTVMWGGFVLNLLLQVVEVFRFIGIKPEVLMAYFALGNLYILYKLIREYIAHRESDLKSLFKLTLLGQMVGFLPFLLLFGVPRLFGVPFIPVEAAAICLLGLPLVYLYMFTTQRLFDIDFFLSRFSYYTMLAFVPTLIITGLAVLIMSQNQLPWLNWVQLFLIVYLLITVFLFGKEFLDHRLRPKWSKDLNNFQGSLDRFSSRISRVMKQADLERVLEQEIRTILPIRDVKFFSYEQDAASMNRTTGKPGQTASAPTPENEQVAAQAVRELAESGRKLAVGVAVVLSRGLAVVIGQKRSTYHILWVGDKTNRTKFNLDELSWLKTLANYSAIVYENLYLIENLIGDLEAEMSKRQGTPTWVLRMIFQLAESERRKLASDLHDSALQDQLIWYRKLEAAMLDHELSEELRNDLTDIREGLLDVIHQIRETCNELRPPLLTEMGLVESLRSLFEQQQIRANYSIEFEAGPLTEALSDEATLTLFRIVQELLVNAGKHAKASRIWIELGQENGIRLRYKDDGIGLAQEKLGDSYQHMGLSGIKERVRSLAGKIRFFSEPGEGLEVDIWLPEKTAVSEGEDGKDGHDSNLAG
ncbi:two-component system, NarL family, sensor histidine kinase ComP [Paenibacillaceae bacterium GAS479]|nr:two-component system, NarL family, sensor histidine kinase ComP [Paenibacillaceae bacterium GAS479]